ncbi:MAG: DNRLRE domain-containing protein, partial [Melioribacteraceae bacterium]|nr:DNRLRE domain-containing protein [Melioribacteraceae bacterium]
MINPKLGEAASQTIKIYASEGDGYLIARNYNDDWDELHDRTTAIGEGVDTEGAFYTGKEDIYVQTSKYYKWGRQSYVAVRPLIPFDTSLIPDDAEIVSANLNLYPATWKDGDTEIHVVQTTQSDTHSIIVEDFDQVGAIDNPTEGGSFNSNVTPNQYISIPINNVGLNWVNKDGWTKLGLRTHEDAYDISPVRNNGASFYSSEELDVTKRPYLEITYTTPDVDSFPLYTQIKSPYPSLLETESWASTTYAEGKGNTGDYKCGLSI